MEDEYANNLIAKTEFLGIAEEKSATLQAKTRMITDYDL
jgi:hypothetical protein